MYIHSLACMIASCNVFNNKEITCRSRYRKGEGFLWKWRDEKPEDTCNRLNKHEKNAKCSTDLCVFF